MTTTQPTIDEDPSSTAPRATPTIPNGGTFSVYNKVRINAPPEAVYNALIDISRWGEWNTFVPEVSVDKPAAAQKDTSKLAEGTQITLHTRMSKDDSVTKSQEIVVQAGPLKTGERTVVRWVAKGFPSFVLKAEHVNWLDDLGDGTTEYAHWETFAGPVALVIRTMYGASLQKYFFDWAEELKAFVEKGRVSKTTEAAPSKTEEPAPTTAS